MNICKKILLFHVDGKKASRIQTLCRTLHFQTKIVSGTQYRNSLGYVAGITGIPPIGQDDHTGLTDLSHDPFQKEMLIFSGMTSEELDLFLSSYRESGMEPIALKAVITPDNVFWSIGRLYRELEKEHSRLNKH